MAKEWAKAFYNSKEWQEVRELRIGKDHGLCKICGKPGNEVDHIIELTPENINDEKIALNLDNLQTLCHRCHRIKTREHHGGGISEKKRVLDRVVFNADGFPVKVHAPRSKE